MAKYNAAKHRIESDDGRLLATLTEHVETSKAWEIADWWGGDYDEIDNLRSEITSAEWNLNKAQESDDDARGEIAELEDKLDSAKLKIEDLELKIEGLEEQLAQKGAQAA
jgi:chromosome segregation ATPase